MNALAKVSESAPQMSSANPMMPQSMNQAVQLAEMMSQGRLVPAHLQKSPGDCLMVIELSMRLAMSPFAVAQCTSVISGKLMLEGKLVGAALNASGLLKDRMKYEFTGSGKDLKVLAYATVKGEDKRSEVEVEFAKVRTSNKMWETQPDQQLVYSANRIWARRFAPEVMLGVYTPEEFDEQPQREQFSGTTIEVQSEVANPQSATAAATQKASETVDGMVNKLEACEAAEEWLEYDTKSQNYRERLARNNPELAKKLDGAFEDARKRLFADPESEIENATGEDLGEAA